MPRSSSSPPASRTGPPRPAFARGSGDRESVVRLAHAVAADPRLHVGRRVSRAELELARRNAGAVATLLLVRWVLDDERGPDAYDRLLRAMHRKSKRPAVFTERELDVLHAAAGGHTCPSTGELLGIGTETVKTLRAHAIARSGARNTTHAVAIAIRAGLI